MTSEKDIEIIPKIVPLVSRNVDEETLLTSLNINEANNSLTAIRETENVSYHDIMIDHCENILKIGLIYERMP